MFLSTQDDVIKHDYQNIFIVTNYVKYVKEELQ
jgi:hypothetical protein